MITYKEIAFTAYGVTNMPRARKFYEKVLGLKLARKMGPKFVEYDIGGGTIAVGCAPKIWPPSRKGTVAALEVADFDAAQHTSLPDYNKLSEKALTRTTGLGLRQIDGTATQGGGMTLTTTLMAASGTRMAVIQVISRPGDMAAHETLVKQIVSGK